MEGGSAFHLVTNGHTLKGEEERVHQGLVLVHQHARPII